MIGMVASAKSLLALGLLLTPAGGWNGAVPHGAAAQFKVGAAVTSFSPPLAGHAPGGDPANCAGASAFTGPRQFAYEEPYTDSMHDGHYDQGDPYLDCNHDGRWDGNLLGGGNNTPRYYTQVADPVGARAIVVGNGSRTMAVEVVDQEGLFNVYADQIRALVTKAGIHLKGGIYISATHDESAPDSLGLGGVSVTTSGVNNYWVQYMVRQSALAIEHAYHAMRAAKIRYTEVLEPSNVRQCWSSYPFVDDQHMPVLQAVSAGRRPHVIATLVDVSQHDETLGFNGGPPGSPLNAQADWVSSDWIHFFRDTLEKQFGGVAIEMAGSVGSNESPEVYSQAISRIPQQFIDASHPAGCRTLFDVGSGTDAAGTEHVPIGYDGETRAFGLDMAGPVIAAIKSGTWYWSPTNTVWGATANICVPLQNALFELGATLGVFANRPGYNADCTKRNPVLQNGTTTGTSLQSQVAAFQIGDGEFLAVPGEVFPFTFLRGFQGPEDMQTPSDPLPPWPLPSMHAQFRFIDGLAEDMLGYIFPAGNATGIPSATNLSPSDTDRFGCGHSDDSEAASGDSGNIIGTELVRLLHTHGGAPEQVVEGRYVLPGGMLSRDPLGGPEIKCNIDQTFHYAGPAVAVKLANGKLVHPKAWMSLSGLPQTMPDRDTRGYIDARGHRVWLDVFPDLTLP
jgi:hypothetical protein